MKKKTRAYKIGYSDGCERRYKNNYAHNSKQFNDYRMGYSEGLTIFKGKNFSNLIKQIRDKGYTRCVSATRKNKIWTIVAGFI